MSRIKLSLGAVFLVAMMAFATSASAQVGGAGPYGVGTPVATPFNSQYYPHQVYGGIDTRYYNNGYVTGYSPYSVDGVVYRNDRDYRRALRRHQRALRRANRSNSVLPYLLR